MKKQCKTCGEIKPLELFHRQKDNKDGRMGECKICSSKRAKEWRKNNPQASKAHQKTYRKSPSYKRAAKKYQRTEKYKQTNKKLQKRYREDPVMSKKIKCRHITGYLIKKGIIKRKLCEYPGCKNKRKAEAHHFNYDEPEEVIFYCKKHHAMIENVKG